MKISELPPEIRALAEKNRAADKVVPGNQSDELCNAFQFNESPEGRAFWCEWADRPSFATIPSPETLRPLLEAALAVMEPNDPAREDLKIDATLAANGCAHFTVYFFFCGDGKSRDCYAKGNTPEEALEAFKAKYTPPPTKAGLIAFHKAELAKLEGSK